MLLLVMRMGVLLATLEILRAVQTQDSSIVGLRLAMLVTLLVRLVTEQQPTTVCPVPLLAISMRTLVQHALEIVMPRLVMRLVV